MIIKLIIIKTVKLLSILTTVSFLKVNLTNMHSNLKEHVSEVFCHHHGGQPRMSPKFCSPEAMTSTKGVDFCICMCLYLCVGRYVAYGWTELNLNYCLMRFVVSDVSVCPVQCENIGKSMENRKTRGGNPRLMENSHISGTNSHIK